MRTTSLALVAILPCLVSALLWRDGVAARAVLLPISPSAYYGAQALFVGPWLALLATLFALLAGGMARGLGGRGSLRATWQALVPVWALAVLVLFVLPDLFVVVALGREHLVKAMRFYGPLAPIVIVVLATRRLRALHAITTGRAALAVIVALLGQTVVGATLLR